MKDINLNCLTHAARAQIEAMCAELRGNSGTPEAREFSGSYAAAGKVSVNQPTFAKSYGAAGEKG